MPKRASRFDIHLPLSDNSGNVFSNEQFDAVEDRLVKRFGGVTTQQRQFPLRGIWQGEHRLYFDLVVVMTALDFSRSGSTRFIATLKRDLLREFKQIEILITEQALKVH